MEWGHQTFGRQLVLITTPEETIFLAYGYVGGGVGGVCGGGGARRVHGGRSQRGAWGEEPDRGVRVRSKTMLFPAITMHLLHVYVSHRWRVKTSWLFERQHDGVPTTSDLER